MVAPADGRSACVKQNCAASAKPSSRKASASRVHSSEAQLGPESKAGTRCEVSKGAASRVVRRRDELWLEVGSTGIARPSGVASGGALNCSSHAARRARRMCSRDLRSSCSTYNALAATEKL